MLAMLWLAPAIALHAGDPAFNFARVSSFVAPPDLTIYSNTAVLTLTNCTDTNYFYTIQSSTNLQDWITDPYNYFFAARSPGQTLTAYAVATGDICFYRAVTVPIRPIPLFKYAIAAGTNININGKNFRADSYDSSDTNYSTYLTNGFTGTNGIWIYGAGKAKSGGDVATDTAVKGSLNLGNGTIYGHLFTGPGAEADVVQMGPHGTVGDLAWAASNEGIEGDGTPTSWWQTNFNVTFPTLRAPTFSGTALPAVTTTGVYAGFIVIPQGSGISNFVVTLLPSSPIWVVGNATLWVKGSALASIRIAATNNASLDLYVGTTSGNGDTISILGTGGSNLNQPGYARNLRIFGLPSLNAIDMHGNAGWAACVYAPNADVLAGGAGNNVQDAAGALVVRSFTLKGHFNLHYDESLKANGPTY
ncbi:MAG: hypothetical protein JWR69_2324 [Pedosphaera sp.]|nr:hypothetical protein [Pedosphaera sp.]